MPPGTAGLAPPRWSRAAGLCPLEQRLGGMSKFACTASTSSWSSSASIRRIRASASRLLRPRPRSSAPWSARPTRSRPRTTRAPRAPLPGPRRSQVTLRTSPSTRDVLGAGVDRGDQVVLGVALGVDQHHAALLELPRPPIRARRGCRRACRRRGGSRRRCGCGCRSAPRPGSRRRRDRSPRRRRARSARRRRPRPSRGRSPAGCCPWASSSSRAFSIAAARVKFASGSPPPSRAAIVIARASFVNSWPRRASVAAFLCLIEAHLEWPDMGLILGSNRRRSGPRPNPRSGRGTASASHPWRRSLVPPRPWRKAQSDVALGRQQTRAAEVAAGPLRRSRPAKLAVLLQQLAVDLDPAAAAQVADHVGVDGALVVPAALRVARANRQVHGAADLLVEQDVAGAAVDPVVGADPELAETAGARRRCRAG